MPAFESSRLISATPSEVFSLVGDGVRLRELANEPEGAPMRTEVTVRHTGGPPAGPGATYEATERIAGRDMGPATFVTDAYEPDRRVAYRSDGGFDSVFELQPADGGTLLTCRREYEDHPAGILRRAAVKYSLTDETVIPEIERELERIDYALRGSPAAEPTEAGGFRMTVLVDAPPSAVFAHVSDGRHLAEWLDPSGELAQAEHLGGPISGWGARYRLTRRDGDGPPEDHDFSTVEFEPGRRVAYEFPGQAVEVLEVTPAADGTRLSLERRPAEGSRGLRARLVRRAFTAERIVPQVERTLDAIRSALAAQR